MAQKKTTRRRKNKASEEAKTRGRSMRQRYQGTKAPPGVTGATSTATPAGQRRFQAALTEGEMKKGKTTAAYRKKVKEAITAGHAVPRKRKKR